MLTQRLRGDDKELIEQCRVGNRDAWDSFLERYRGLLVKTVRACLQPYSDPNCIEDLVQQVVVSFWSQLVSGLWREQTQVPVASYLRSACRNASKNWQQAHRKERARIRGVPLVRGSSCTDLTAEDLDELETFLKALPRRMAQTLASQLGNQCAEDYARLSPENRRQLKHLLFEDWVSFQQQRKR